MNAATKAAVHHILGQDEVRAHVSTHTSPSQILVRAAARCVRDGIVDGPHYLAVQKALKDEAGKPHPLA